MLSRKSKFEQIESPVRPLAEPERWTVPTETDHERVLAAAQALRIQATRRLAHAFANSVARLWHDGIVEPIARWRERERTIRELSMLNERELADIGLSPGMIPFVAAGKFQPEAEPIERAPANENHSPRRAA